MTNSFYRLGIQEKKKRDVLLAQTFDFSSSSIIPAVAEFNFISKIHCISEVERERGKVQNYRRAFCSLASKAILGHLL